MKRYLGSLLAVALLCMAGRTIQADDTPSLEACAAYAEADHAYQAALREPGAVHKAAVQQADDTYKAVEQRANEAAEAAYQQATAAQNARLSTGG